MDPQPVHIIWHITNACNLRCGYCYAKAFEQKPEESNYDLIVRRINESKVKILSIIGGEPLLVEELPRIVKKIRKDIYINIESNITLIKDKWDSVYKRTSFSTTVDGPNAKIHNRTRGLFNKVIEGIKFLLHKGVEVRVNIVVNKHNYRYLDQTVKFLSKIGINRICLGQVRCFGLPKKEDFLLSEKEYEEAIEKVLKIRQENKNLIISLNGWYDPRIFKEGYFYKPSCFCGVWRVTIDWNGRCYPCELMAFYKSPLCEEAGLLEHESIKEIMRKNDLFRNFREATFKYFPLSCKECKYKNLCNHGCRYIAYLNSGTLFGKNIYCKVRKPDIYDVLGLEYYLPDNKYAKARYSGKLADFLRNNIEKINKPLLDVGCGAGLWTFFLAKLGKRVIGIDSKQEMIALAKYYLKKENKKISSKVKFYNESLKDYKLKDIQSALFLGNTLGHFSFNEFEEAIKKLKENKVKNIILEYMDLSRLIFNSDIEFEWCGHRFKEKYRKLSKDSFLRTIKNLENGLKVQLKGYIWTRERVKKIMEEYNYHLEKEIQEKNNIVQLFTCLENC